MEIIKKIQMKDDFYVNKSVTIAFIGDSVTHGCFECYVRTDGQIDTIFEMGSSYTQHVKEILNRLYPRSQVNIISSGLSGDMARNGKTRFERDVLSFNPDLVVISYGLNDASWNEREGIAEYVESIREMIDKARENGAEVIFMTQNYMTTYVSHLLPKDEVMVEAAKHSMEIQNSGLLKEYFEAAKKMCEEENVKVVDMYSIWEKMANGGVDPNNLLANRLNHPVRWMHEYMAIKLVEEMFED